MDSSPPATARALEGCPAAPGVDGRCSAPRLRREETIDGAMAGMSEDECAPFRAGTTYFAPSQPHRCRPGTSRARRGRIGVLPPHRLSGNRDRRFIRQRSGNKERRGVRPPVPLLGQLCRRMI